MQAIAVFRSRKTQTSRRSAHEAPLASCERYTGRDRVRQERELEVGSNLVVALLSDVCLLLSATSTASRCPTGGSGS